jgi:hypothetical protein
VFDFVSGRIDRGTFERVVDDPFLAPLKRGLDEGLLAVELELTRDKLADDDVVSVRLGVSGTVSRFTRPLPTSGTSNPLLQGAILTFSSRAIFDYVSGRIYSPPKTSSSALGSRTGESFPVEKFHDAETNAAGSPTEIKNTCSISSCIRQAECKASAAIGSISPD